MEDKAGMLSSSLFDQVKKAHGPKQSPQYSANESNVIKRIEKLVIYTKQRVCLPSSTYDNSKIECLYPNNSWQDLTRIYLVLLTLTTLVVY